MINVMKKSTWYVYAFSILGLLCLNYFQGNKIEEQRLKFEKCLTSGESYDYFVRLEEQEDTLNVLSNEIKEITSE